MRADPQNCRELDRTIQLYTHCIYKRPNEDRKDCTPTDIHHAPATFWTFLTATFKWCCISENIDCSYWAHRKGVKHTGRQNGESTARCLLICTDSSKIRFITALHFLTKVLIWKGKHGEKYKLIKKEIIIKCKKQWSSTLPQNCCNWHVLQSAVLVMWHRNQYSCGHIISFCIQLRGQKKKLLRNVFQLYTNMFLSIHCRF